MSDLPQYYPEEFFPILEKLPKVGQVVICGGQAVNLLAAVFLTKDEIEEILGADGSATSADMDIVISRDLQSKICGHANKTKGFSIHTFADCRQPIQFAISSKILPDSRIDVLRSINGIHTVKDRVFEDALEIEDIPFSVMNPITLLIAKATNCATLEQQSATQKRNDITHLRLLIPIVRSYLCALTEHCPLYPDSDSKAEQRVIIRLLKKLDKVSTNAIFLKGLKIARGDLSEAIPIRKIQASELTALRSYVDKSFMRDSKKIFRSS